MVLVATQVKRRRGTTAENDAFTGAEGEITVDTEKHQLRVHDGETQGGFVIGSGGSGRNIGDIFYTTRTDSGLGGAVECNGGTYSTADYTGAGSIGELLEAGKLPYVSLAEYATLLSTNGVVGVFGWDGTGTTSFRVPTLQDVFIECGQAAQLGNYMPAGLPNITASVNGAKEVRLSDYTGAFYSETSKSQSGTANVSGSDYHNLYLDASRSSSIYGNSDTVQPKAVKYRAMVQLFNSTTDEAVATVGTVVAQVGENTTQIANRVVKGHELIDFQIPTAANGYTWYRKYADGWVEQGGDVSGTNGTITFPITMAGSDYQIMANVKNKSITGSNSVFSLLTNNLTTTSFGFKKTYNNGSETGMAGENFFWQVSGMAAA